MSAQQPDPFLDSCIVLTFCKDADRQRFKQKHHRIMRTRVQVEKRLPRELVDDVEHDVEYGWTLRSRRSRRQKGFDRRCRWLPQPGSCLRTCAGTYLSFLARGLKSERIPCYTARPAA